MKTTGPTMTQHTPGPWHVGMRPGPMVYGPLGEQVADCRGLEESGRNARAIAAVPAMLVALQMVAENAGHTRTCRAHARECSCYIAVVNAAIRRAVDGAA